MESHKEIVDTFLAPVVAKVIALEAKLLEQKEACDEKDKQI